MFDFIAGTLPPGESWEDAHHLGLYIRNPASEEWGRIVLHIDAVWLELRIGPREAIELTDEQSAGCVIIQNSGPVELQVEWRKSRD